MASSPAAVRLAQRLRALRESHSGLTQAGLARALSDDARVAVATISSWENLTTPKLPPADRLRSYASFFCTDRSTDGSPHLIPEQDLFPDERERFEALYEELVGLREAARSHSGAVGAAARGSSTWVFDSEPVTIVCPEIPEDERPRLASERDPNYTRMYRYADLDALIELWGHIRAFNPDLTTVMHRLPSEVTADHMQGHLIVLGGIGWNYVTERLLRTLRQLPISQFEVSDLKTGEILKASGPGGQEFYPQFEDRGNGPELVEDVGLLTRLRNPFNHSRTITICNGIHSRGVLGAVRALTDLNVREQNEEFLANRFPDGEFALLLRVPVVHGEAISPDLDNPYNRLYEWSPGEKKVAAK